MDNLQTQISELLNEKRISVLRGQKSMHQIFSNLICQIHDVDEDGFPRNRGGYRQNYWEFWIKKDELIKIYEAEVEALRRELSLTREYIYRDYDVLKGISRETTQDMIDEFIKTQKSWFTLRNKLTN